MKRLYCRTAAILVIAFAVLPMCASADMPRPPKNDNSQNDQPPRPDPKRGNTLNFIIEAGDVEEAQLHIPMNVFSSLQSDPDGASASLSAGSGLSPLHSAVSGIALSLSIVLGGLWLVRSRRRLGTRSATAAVAIFGVLAGTAALSFANLGPPPNYHPVDPGTLLRAIKGGDKLAGKVRYYYDGNDNEIRLIIPRKADSR